MAAFATFKSGMVVEFHTGSALKNRFIHKNDWMEIVSIQADGHELDACLDILGRNLKNNFRVFTFVGVNAQEIAVNWR